MIPVFDGHNDSLLRLYQHCQSSSRAFLEGLDEGTPRAIGHLDLPRARAGGFQGGFFAIFVPPTRDLDLGASASGKLPKGYDQPVPQEIALRVTLEMISLHHRLVTASGGAIRHALRADDLDLVEGGICSVLHIEGAEAIDPKLSNLEAIFAVGVRSIGPVWSRSNAFGHGVPFRFPSSPDIGDGLTAAGRNLVLACRDLGILIDLSHLNEKGFWDVTTLGDAPLVATHCCAHALAPSSRNLTDDQLRAVRDSDGVVGLNFHVGDLRAEGGVTRKQPITRMVEHIDHLAEVMGVRHVALGSDFDGALMPAELSDAAQLPKLTEALLEHGYSREDVEQIAHGNWIRCLRHSLPAA